MTRGQHQGGGGVGTMVEETFQFMASTETKQTHSVQQAAEKQDPPHAAARLLLAASRVWVWAPATKGHTEGKLREAGLAWRKAMRRSWGLTMPVFLGDTWRWPDKIMHFVSALWCMAENRESNAEKTV